MTKFLKVQEERAFLASHNNRTKPDGQNEFEAYIMSDSSIDAAMLVRSPATQCPLPLVPLAQTVSAHLQVALALLSAVLGTRLCCVRRVRRRTAAGYRPATILP